MTPSWSLMKAEVTEMFLSPKEDMPMRMMIGCLGSVGNTMGKLYCCDEGQPMALFPQLPQEEQGGLCLCDSEDYPVWNHEPLC